MSKFKEEIEISVKDGFSKESKQVEKSMFNMQNAIRAVGAAIAGAAIVKGLKSSVAAFVEEEKQIVRQRAALRGLGIESELATKRMTEFATEMQRSTRFGNESVLATTTLLTQFGLVGEELEQTTKAAADLSSALGVDLQTSTRLLARAFEGDVGSLKRYGIDIKQAEFEAKGFAAVLDEIEGKFGGTAQAEAESYAGQLEILKNEFTDLTKVVGEITVSIIQKTGVLQTASKWLTEFNDAIQRNRDLQNQASLATLDSAKRLQELREELEYVTNGTFVHIHGVQTQQVEIQRLNKLIEEEEARYKELDDKLGDVIQTRKEEVKALEEVQFAIQNEKKATQETTKAKEKATDEFAKFYRNLVKENKSSFQNIRDLREADTVQLKRWQKEQVISAEQFAAAMEQVSKRSIRENLDLASSGLDGVTSLAQGNISAGITQIASLFPPQIQGIISFAQSAFGTIKSIVSLFSKDTRTEFEKINTSISRIRREFAAARSELEALVDEEARLRQGQAAQGKIGELLDLKSLTEAAGLDLDQLQSAAEGSPLGTESRVLAQLRSTLRRNLRAEIASDGTIGLFDGKTVFALQRPDGQIDVRRRLSGFNEAATASVARALINQLMSEGLLRPQGGDNPLSFATGGLVGGGSGFKDDVNANLTGGEFVMSKKGVNPRTLGMLKRMNAEGQASAGGANVTIHAIDAQSFEQFMMTKGAKVLRELSGRGRVPLMNTQGVSGNI